MTKANSDAKFDFVKDAVAFGSQDCILWPYSTNKDGYGWLSRLGEKYAHRVAFRLANGDIAKGLHVLHSCDTPGCVNPKHLSVGSHKENMLDKAAKGRAPRDTTKHVDNRGSKHGKAVLTESDAKNIRAEYALGGITQQQLAAKYGVSRQTVSDVIRRVGWAHVF